MRAVEWIGRNSIVTYLAHSPLLIPVGAVIAGSELGASASTLVSFVVVLGLCLALTLARPWTEWLYRLPLPALPALSAAAPRPAMDREMVSAQTDRPTSGTYVHA